MLRNMALSLVEHGQVTTTLPKAKALRPYVEKLVTLAVKTRKSTLEKDPAGALRARRAIHKIIGDRGLVPKEHREAYAGMSDAARARTMRMQSGRRHRTGDPKGRLAFTGESVTHRLIETVAPQFEGRSGGYTRLVRLATRRIGDASFLAILQFVGGEEAPVSLTKPGKSSRRRKADARYAMAIKAAKAWSGKGRADVGVGKKDDDAEVSSEQAESTSDDGEGGQDSVT